VGVDRESRQVECVFDTRVDAVRGPFTSALLNLKTGPEAGGENVPTHSVPCGSTPRPSILPPSSLAGKPPSWVM